MRSVIGTWYSGYCFDSLEYINIPNEVRSIGEGAFDGCKNLANIEIPDNIISIEERAFYGCSSLSNITIPDSVTSIGPQAFFNTAWYSNQPDGLVYAGKVAYKYKGTMTSNTELEIRDDTTSICSSAFAYCRGLSRITIPDSVISIGDNAFENCTSLGNIIIPDSVASIGKDAFTNTAWIDSQPDGVVYAGKVAYKYKGTMPSDTELELEEGTKGITGNAFSNCDTLKSITIPNSVTNIGERAFYSCSSLSSITIPNSVTDIECEVFSGCTELSSVTIPENVTSIGNDAFYYCTSLSSITIPNSVTTIEKYAFAFCKNLNSVTISDNIKKIDHGTFLGCGGLSSITIPEGVTSIGGYAFSYCTSLSSVTIPDRVTKIGNSAFKDVPHIYVSMSATGAPWGATEVVSGTGDSQENPKPDIPFNAEEWDKTAAPEDVFIWANEDSTSPDYGKIVGYKAYVDNYPVLRYPSRCTSVGVDTSYITGTSEEIETIRSYTKNVKKVELPETVTEIGSNAYSKHCFDSMKEINIPNNVKSIGAFAFYDCTSLSSITIPNSVTSIGYDAFNGIHTVYYCGRILKGAPWGALAIN